MKLRILTAMVFLCSLLSCGMEIFEVSDELPKKNWKKITIMTYNTQLFFDATENGTEFDEFKPPKWSQEKYETRLDRLIDTLCIVGKECGNGHNRGSDIVVLQEIENDQTLRDICNRLPHTSKYEHAVFIQGGEGAAFGVGILSRVKVESVTSHTPYAGKTILRPIGELQINAGGETFTLFAIHWKSKTGNVDDSAIRIAQESLLMDRITQTQSRGEKWIALGDFNQKLEEFSSLDEAYNCWPGWISALETKNAIGPFGSYWYQDAWECIDHVFTSDAFMGSEGLTAKVFRVHAATPFADESLHPIRYDTWNGNGYSDHLPLSLVLER